MTHVGEEGALGAVGGFGLVFGFFEFGVFCFERLTVVAFLFEHQCLYPLGLFALGVVARAEEDGRNQQCQNPAS